MNDSNDYNLCYKLKNLSYNFKKLFENPVIVFDTYDIMFFLLIKY